MALMQAEEPSPQRQEPRTLEALFEALESPLLTYGLRLTGDPAAAEDLVQDAFMRLHAQFEQVNEPRRWLYRTVHNLALNRKRDEAKVIPLNAGPSGEPEEPATDPTDPQPLPDEQIARWEGIGLVRISLEALDERSRELVRLKFTEGLSYKQMSERTGLTVGNVGYLLHHALKTVADELARNGFVS